MREHMHVDRHVTHSVHVRSHITHEYAVETLHNIEDMQTRALMARNIT